ncbi:unnamed protein product [Tenebrio molitor]|nr:unnamed protein product [Tenebrio molitor]
MTLSKCKLLLLVKMKLLEVCSLSLSFSFKREVGTATMLIYYIKARIQQRN